MTDPTSESTRLLVPADVGRLGEVRAFVRSCAADAGASSDVADDLVQAVDEAVCNVMLHGYGGAPGDVEVASAVRDGALEFTILDRAPVFDPTTTPVVDPAEPPRPTRPGGMGVGVHLLRTMTDSVRHHVRPGGGNALTLTRRIDATKEG